MKIYFSRVVNNPLPRTFIFVDADSKENKRDHCRRQYAINKRFNRLRKKRDAV